MTSLSRPRVEFISTILQTVLNLGLLCLGLILVVFLGKETVHLADVLFAPEQTSKYEQVEGGFAPIFPDTCYHLTHYWPAAADIPVASDNPVH
ncbi:hypothetical protein NEO12_03670, partial [Escherichia coli]|nr:hypothetical protein [Escherichia coli]MDI0526424.1 hypothetical protein [Escherichia coli]